VDDRVAGPTSLNFGFLSEHDEQLVRFAALAERYFADDPNTCLIKLRQFAELLAQSVAARTAHYENAGEGLGDLLRRLSLDRVIPREAADLFHQLRKVGNAAAHDGTGDYREALSSLKIARQLAIWFHRTFGRNVNFRAGPFAPPRPPEAVAQELAAELERLRAVLAEHQSAVEQAQREATDERRLRETVEEKARRDAAERTEWEQLAIEADAARLDVERRLAAFQAQAEQRTADETIGFQQRASAAAAKIDLDEAETRAIIDQRLRDRGWEADSAELRYATGVRPVKGRNMAIAEWPTASGPADYALCIGTKCIGVVEGKRKRKNVSAAIDQAERYSKGFRFDDVVGPVGGPWGEYRVPFVFAANGRPYLKQLETESGIWFRDVREATNHRRS
jgi:type I restriction enzyme, R subunit